MGFSGKKWYMSYTLSNGLKDFANPSSITYLHLTLEQPPRARINVIPTALRKSSPQTVPLITGALKPFVVHSL